MESENVNQILGGRYTGWIQTYTGRRFFPLKPDSSDVCIEDIAHALALKCRYTGHCKEFFSIAQHSVMVSRMVPEVDAPWGLLHDAGEAYLPDVARPIKHRMQVVLYELPEEDLAVGFSDVEAAILKTVAFRYGLPQQIPPSVHEADVRCLEYERRQLMGPPPEEWATAPAWDGDTTPIDCWQWAEAERRFLERWHEILTGRAG